MTLGFVYVRVWYAPYNLRTHRSTVCSLGMLVILVGVFCPPESPAEPGDSAFKSLVFEPTGEAIVAAAPLACAPSTVPEPLDDEEVLCMGLPSFATSSLLSPIATISWTGVAGDTSGVVVPSALPNGEAAFMPLLVVASTVGLSLDKIAEVNFESPLTTLPQSSSIRAWCVLLTKGLIPANRNARGEKSAKSSSSRDSTANLDATGMRKRRFETLTVGEKASQYAKTFCISGTTRQVGHIIQQRSGELR